MELPELNKETVEESVERGKRLISWLPDPYQCDHCGSLCDADNQYVAEQALPDVPVWQCPNDDCGKRYYRDEKDVL